MKKLVWCLAVVVAVSGCVTPGQRYAALKEESLKARTLEEAVKASPLRKVRVGREIKTNLNKPDDILLTSDGASSDSYYVSYYQLYAFAVVAGKSYTLTVKSFCDCLGFQKLMPVPEAYVVDGEGRLISRVLQPVHQEGFNGGLEGTWGFTAEENGQYFLVLAANNSDPGQVVGEVVGFVYNPISKTSNELKLPLQSSTTGSMTFEINAF
ncbi:hypothetical protein [Hyalangium sp.]|uniref:hypothetical protein n=1 Tax=Hyalangium sp. TaxID=2028555 RepID=UPI002D2C88E3|nr:hypothetical protein [Hyalangium sp.]HYH96680.1 hypothetical protein [Hyalangium sp.]